MYAKGNNRFVGAGNSIAAAAKTHLHYSRRTRFESRQFSVAGVLALVLLAASPEANAQDARVRVSVKVVADQAGSLPQDNASLEQAVRAAFDEANEALVRLGAGWVFNLEEIVTVPGIPEWFAANCADKDLMEDSAKADPARFAWRNDAINYYVVRLNGCEGVCSFPFLHDDIILINGNRLDTLENGIIWLHETGHYFGLTHSFECLSAGCDTNICTGVGGADPSGHVIYCYDNCPHDSNVMSYFPGVRGSNAKFSDCQMNIMEDYLHAQRSYVIDDAPSPPNPPPPRPEPTDDEFEENDSYGEAREISLGTYSLRGMDDDWFLVTMRESGTLSIKVTGAGGDLDLFVGDESDWIGESTSEDSHEFVEFDVSPGDYIIVVTPYQGLTSPYQMAIDFEPRPTRSGGPSVCGAGCCQALIMGFLGFLGFATVRSRRTN